MQVENHHILYTYSFELVAIKPEIIFIELKNITTEETRALKTLYAIMLQINTNGNLTNGTYNWFWIN